MGIVGMKDCLHQLKALDDDYNTLVWNTHNKEIINNRFWEETMQSSLDKYQHKIPKHKR